MEKNDVRELVNNFFRECSTVAWGESLDALLRVKLVRQERSVIKQEESNFQIMKRLTENFMGHFNGDETLFDKTYSLLAAVDVFAFMEALAEKLEKDYGGLQVPSVLWQLVCDKLKASSCRTVLLPEAERILSGIIGVAKAFPEKKFVIPTMNEQMFRLQSLAYEEYPNVEVVWANIYDASFSEQKYDFIFSLPAFNAMNINQKGTFIDSKSDLIATENLLNALATEGQMMILLPARITFGGGNVAKLRRFIEEKYSVDSISAMPNGLLYPFTAIRTYLMEFSVGETTQVQVRAYESDQKRSKNGVRTMYCTKQSALSKEDFDELGNWNIELLWAEKDEAMEQYQNSSVPKVKLEEVAEIFRGKMVKEKSMEGNIGLINISNVVGVHLDYAAIDCFQDEIRNVLKYELAEGDVLVTNRGTAIRAGVFEKQDKVCIPSANLTAIRPKEALNGKYLSIFIESPVGQTLLKSIQRGETILNINHKDLCELMIPLPSLEQQEKIVEEYEREAKLYQKITNEAQERWEAARIKLYKELY